MSYKTKRVLQQQQELAAKWQREHRALWTASSDDRFVSLDDDPEAFEDLFVVAESNPEYVLMLEQEIDLVDIMRVDEVAAATATPSVVSRFKNRSFN